MTISNGDVVRYHAQTSGVPYCDPPWVYVTEAEAGFAIMLIGKFDMQEHDVGRTISIGGRGHDMPGRRVMPPEEWPDEVAVLVAKIKLMGKL